MLRKGLDTQCSGILIIIPLSLIISNKMETPFLCVLLGRLAPGVLRHEAGVEPGGHIRSCCSPWAWCHCHLTMHGTHLSRLECRGLARMQECGHLCGCLLGWSGSRRHWVATAFLQCMWACCSLPVLAWSYSCPFT